MINASGTISESMTAFPHTIGKEQTLEKAEDMMRDLNIRHLPVLHAGKLVGVITQRDLLLVKAYTGQQWGTQKASEALIEDAFTCAPTDKVKDVCRTMGERKIGCALVVEAENLVGIFTWVDALRFISKL